MYRCYGELTACIFWVTELFKWMLKREVGGKFVVCAGQFDRLTDRTYRRQEERAGLL